jgi:hypothetical protein
MLIMNDRTPSSTSWWMLEGALLTWLEASHPAPNGLAHPAPDGLASLVAALLTELRRHSGHSVAKIRDHFHSAWEA